MPPFSRTTPPSKISITLPFKYAIILFPCYYSLCRTRIIKHLRDVEAPSPTITFEFRDVEAPSPTSARLFGFLAKLPYCSGFAGRRDAVPYECKTTCRNSDYSCLPFWRMKTACRKNLTILAFRFGEWEPLGVKIQLFLPSPLGKGDRLRWKRSTVE